MRCVTDEGLDLIKHYEGLHLTAYLDAVGVPTIGYGHTRTAKLGQKIDSNTAEALLRSDLREAERAVLRLIKVPLTDGQFDALVSFTFNLGSGALQRSTLRAKINRGDYDGASSEFRKWVFAGGKKLRGLERRRMAEVDLFLSETVNIS